MVPCLCVLYKFTFNVIQTVPASCVLGSSWAEWRRIFAQTK